MPPPPPSSSSPPPGGGLLPPPPPPAPALGPTLGPSAPRGWAAACDQTQTVIRSIGLRSAAAIDLGQEFCAHLSWTMTTPFKARQDAAVQVEHVTLARADGRGVHQPYVTLHLTLHAFKTLTLYRS